MSTAFGEREVVVDAAGYWWLFLLTGIAWFVFSYGTNVIVVRSEER